MDIPDDCVITKGFKTFPFSYAISFDLNWLVH